MLIVNLLLLAFFLFLLVRSADYSIKYATDLAHILSLPRYIIGFIVVAVISILPETFVAVDSALRSVPSFGLGTLFGSNVADLSLVVAIVVLSTAQGLRVGSKILENNRWYPFFIALPILAGFDGNYSRSEGIFLMVAGLSFYYLTLNKHRRKNLRPTIVFHPYHLRNLFFLVLCMTGLLAASHFTVQYGVALAGNLRVSQALVGMLVVGLGTTLPELFFSLRAVRQKSDTLAIGDILGTVISDATIAVGVMALIRPFSFPTRIIYVTALFMVLASLMLFTLMRSGRFITKKEAYYLLGFYGLFVLTEYFLQ